MKTVYLDRDRILLTPPSNKGEYSRLYLHRSRKGPAYQIKHRPFTSFSTSLIRKLDQMIDGAKEVGRDAIVPANGLIVRGFVYDCGGYAKMTRELVFRMQNTIPVSVEPGSSGPSIPQHQIQRLKLLEHRFKGQQYHFMTFGSPTIHTPRERVVSSYFQFETQTINKEIVNLCNRVDEMYVPTEWNRRVFEEAGIRVPMTIVYQGTNASMFRPGKPEHEFDCECIVGKRAGQKVKIDKFAFFNLAGWSVRKGYDIILQAYANAFQGRDDVQLVFLGNYVTKQRKIDDILKYSLPRNAEVLLIDNPSFDEETVVDLYRSCKVYVDGSRGEGWCLPIHEAACVGLPVISPWNSSRTEYLDENNAFLVHHWDKYDVVPGSEESTGWYLNEMWPVLGQDQVDQMTAHMRTCFFDYNYALTVGAVLSQKMRQYTWDRMSDELLKIYFSRRSISHLSKSEEAA